MNNFANPWIAIRTMQRTENSRKWQRMLYNQYILMKNETNAAAAYHWMRISYKLQR